MRDFQFVLKIILLCATTFCCTSATGQTPVEGAQKNLHRQKWQRAYELLNKALAKDSLNVTAKYVLAQYFFSKENPAYDLDSAYVHVLGALHDFQLASLKQRERLKRFPVDSLLITDLHNRIDSAAFARAKVNDSEKGWIDFLDYFVLSSFRSEASVRRDSVAFKQASIENTYQSFENFFKKYPAARASELARQNYEALLLASKTSDKTLDSYESFLAKYPNSPHRRQVEQTIYEYRTASGEYEDFIDFIRKCPTNPFTKKAKNILFHLITPRDRAEKWPADFGNDSLAMVIQLEHDYLVPFLKNKLFGFMNSSGQEIIPAHADSLPSRYQCGNVDEDVVAVRGKIIGKNGVLICNGNVADFDDLGFGFLLVEEANCKSLMHKTGFKIGDDCIDDAKILGGRFAAINVRQQWSIWTLSGKLLLKDLDKIIWMSNVVGLKKNHKVKLLPVSSLGNLPLPPEVRGIEFDFVKAWTNNLIFVKKGEEIGLLDQSLTEILVPAVQTIRPAFSGFITTDSTGSQVHNEAGQKSARFQQILTQKPWTVVKDSAWRFFDIQTMQHSREYDTIIFQGSFALSYRKDSAFVHSPKNVIWKGLTTSAVTVLPADSMVFLLIEKGNLKSVFNQHGKKLFTAAIDRIQYAGDNLFIIHKNEKKGIITFNGTTVLPTIYDAIVTIDNGKFSLLKSAQFGLFDYIKKKQISTRYGKNLFPYNNQIITAYKNGFFGFIGWDDKPLSKFEFSEVKFWNDTTALVKINSVWLLYEIKSRKIVVDKIKDLRFIRDTSAEKLAIVQRNGEYGVFDNHKGTIIPISFSDIINVGSAERPLYFTEKDVAEAELYVVIYYDHAGKMLRKEIYDHDDYDNIYCSER